MIKGTSKNLLRSEILTPSSETRKMSKKTGGVARGYVDGFFVKSDEVAAEGAKLQPKEVFRDALMFLYHDSIEKEIKKLERKWCQLRREGFKRFELLCEERGSSLDIVKV